MRGVKQLKQHLVPKLAERGMAPGAIPLFIRGLAMSIVENPDINVASINLQMRRMGWDDFGMDPDELKAAITCFDAAGLKRLKQKPARWFFKEFEPPDDRQTNQMSANDFDTDPVFDKEATTRAASNRMSFQE